MRSVHVVFAAMFLALATPAGASPAGRTGSSSRRASQEWRTPSLRLAIETPTRGRVSTPFVVTGWALDLAAADGTGIDAIHVWAYPVGDGAPIFLGEARYGDPRADVAAAFGERFSRASYTVSVDHLPRGSYDVIVSARRASTGRFGPAQGVRITVE